MSKLIVSTGPVGRSELAGPNRDRAAGTGAGVRETDYPQSRVPPSRSALCDLCDDCSSVPPGADTQGWSRVPDHGHLEPRVTLTPDRLAREAGTTPAYIARLVEAGAIGVEVDGRFASDDVTRVRLTLALADGGIELDDLMSVIGSGALQLDWVDRLWTVGEPSGRTFDAFAGSLGSACCVSRSTELGAGSKAGDPAVAARRRMRRCGVS